MGLNTKNSMFSNILEDKASEHADLMMEREYRDEGLMSWEMQREKYKNEFFEALEMEPLADALNQAVRDLIDEGGNVLDSKEYADLIDEIREAANTFDAFIEENSIPEILNTATGFSLSALANIELIALDFFHRGQVENSINIYTLLTILDGNHADYWYKLGIGLQEVGNLEKALSAYACCHILDPRNIGSYVFSAECYLKQDFRDDAKVELDLAEFWMTTEDPEGNWKDVINQVKRKMR